MSISTELQILRDNKASIKAAIEAKGQVVGDAPMSEWASKIQAISSSEPSLASLPQDIRFGYSLFVTVPDNIMRYLNIERSNTIFNGMFYACPNLERFEGLTRDPSDVGGMFAQCGKLNHVEIDLSGINYTFQMNNIFGSEYLKAGKLTYIHLKGLGTSPNLEYIPLYGTVAWERESMIKTLLDDSYDRRTAGYADCEIRIPQITMDRLTADDIAAIEAKGYVFVPKTVNP